MPTYEDLLCFYIDMTGRPVQTSPPVLSYADLHTFYSLHVGRPPTPLPPGSIENVGAFITEEEVVTRDEAKEAFDFVQESFSTVGKEQGRMKEGLQGLASKLDEVQGKAAEDVKELARAANVALSHASSIASDLSVCMADAEK